MYIPPSKVIGAGFFGYFLWSTTTDYRRYRFLHHANTSHFAVATEIEERHLGRLYRLGEHLTKDMYEKK